VTSDLLTKMVGWTDRWGGGGGVKGEFQFVNSISKGAC
jgi:hypothetical protein